MFVKVLCPSQARHYKTSPSGCAQHSAAHLLTAAAAANTQTGDEDCTVLCECGARQGPREVFAAHRQLSMSTAQLGSQARFCVCIVIGGGGREVICLHTDHTDPENRGYRGIPTLTFGTHKFKCNMHQLSIRVPASASDSAATSIGMILLSTICCRAPSEPTARLARACRHAAAAAATQLHNVDRNAPLAASSHWIPANTTSMQTLNLFLTKGKQNKRTYLP